MSCVLELITGPATEPVTRANIAANDYLKDLDFSNEKEVDLFDNYLIPSARMLTEKYMNRAIISQTWELRFDLQPDYIYFPKGNLTSVSTVKTISETGIETTETSSHYTVVTGENGLLFLNPGYSWTSTTRPRSMFHVRFVCGWADADNVPEIIKNAIMQTLVHLYENRESTVIPGIAKILMDGYKIAPFGWVY
jgi:uncharacterized phiE125 gp8 family phage protein